MSTDNNRFKRKFIITSFTVGLPLFHLVRNRNEIYKASKLMREYHIKEVIARGCMGFFFGTMIALYFYGFG